MLGDGPSSWWDIEFRDGKVRIGLWWWMLGFAPNGKDQYSVDTIGM